MTETTGFLYPFLDAEGGDVPSLLADLSRSVEAKCSESDRLRASTLEELGPELMAAAAAMVSRFDAGARLLTFGNGGSATDADAVAQLFIRPPYGPPLPALSLAADASVLTALANDVSVDVAFARQLVAHARPGDIALGLSTSGGSENVLQALAAARETALLTIGLAGYDGGRMAADGQADHCLVVHSTSVHRIQEIQAALVHELWRLVVGVPAGAHR